MADVTINSTAVPGTVVPVGKMVSPGGGQGPTGGTGAQGNTGLTGPTGSTGLTGSPAWTTVSTASFTVPAYGATVTVNLLDTSWIALNEWVYVDDANGAGTAGQLVVQSKTPTSVTFLNPSPTAASGPANTSQDGLLRAVSGKTSDFIDGTNNCRDLQSSVASVTAQVPTGVVIDYAGGTSPAGWLLCDGSSYPTATYPALFTAIGYTWGGSGASFNVPDLRSRVTVGAGDGPGALSNRILAATGGEETHVLVAAELAAHTHDITHTHTLGNHTHLGVDHLHSLQGHTHAGINHLHGMDHYHNWGAQGSHTHGDAGHTHTYATNNASGGNNPPGSGYGIVGANTGVGYANIQAANTPAGNTVYASQTNGGWVNTGGADRDLTTGGPSVATTGAADRGLTTGGPSTNTTDSQSTTNSGSIGSGTAHNTMPPFAVMNKIIKT